ncbi:hypothetical protein [Streptomyces durhamensis]|uniref:hypothetical protein n=1 Tax=Streptomyces durhamensis TaxID=68194 RepID=UPI000AEB96C2|nr:hypothetical protein [Streptomyces durhamensis]
MSSSPPSTTPPHFENFAEFRPRELHVSEVHGLVDELLAWARALAPLRALRGHCRVAPAVRRHA